MKIPLTPDDKNSGGVVKEFKAKLKETVIFAQKSRSSFFVFIFRVFRLGRKRGGKGLH